MAYRWHSEVRQTLLCRCSVHRCSPASDVCAAIRRK